MTLRIYNILHKLNKNFITYLIWKKCTKPDQIYCIFRHKIIPIYNLQFIPNHFRAGGDLQEELLHLSHFLLVWWNHEPVCGSQGWQGWDFMHRPCRWKMRQKPLNNWIDRWTYDRFTQLLLTSKGWRTFQINCAGICNFNIIMDLTGILLLSHFYTSTKISGLINAKKLLGR